MKFNCQCVCGEMFQKDIENPTALQVADDMYHGFILVDCKEHEEF